MEPQEDGDILVTSKGNRLRIERAPTVGDLVHVGDWVRTSYGTGGLVIAVRRYEYFSVVHAWTIMYVIPGVASQDKNGKFYDSRHYNWLNEYVAVGDRILKLFENNHDEVFVVPAPAEALRLARPAQLHLL